MFPKWFLAVFGANTQGFSVVFGWFWRNLGGKTPPIWGPPYPPGGVPREAVLSDGFFAHATPKNRW